MVEAFFGNESMKKNDIRYARQVLDLEAKAILSIKARLGRDFSSAVSAILSCKGRVVLTGMGKAGIVAQKISATFASTGTPSLFLHPAEAFHGDLGRVTSEDIVLAMSNSGETEEMIRLVPSLKKIGARIVSITSRRSSSLGKFSDITLETGDIKEVCPLGLSPSASTAAALALGDALCLTVLKNRRFDKKNFAFFHPGGKLGINLMKVEEVMRTGKANVAIRESASVKDALMAITRARAGAASIVDANGRIKGIFTDGDLRRLMGIQGASALLAPMKDVMTRSPRTLKPDAIVSEAVKLLKEKRIDEMPVVGPDGKLKGMLDVQDLLEIGAI